MSIRTGINVCGMTKTIRDQQGRTSLYIVDHPEMKTVTQATWKRIHLTQPSENRISKVIRHCLYWMKWLITSGTKSTNSELNLLDDKRHYDRGRYTTLYTMLSTLDYSPDVMLTQRSTFSKFFHPCPYLQTCSIRGNAKSEKNLVSHIGQVGSIWQMVPCST